MLSFKVLFFVCAVLSTSQATIRSDLDEDNFRSLKENIDDRVDDLAEEATGGGKVIWGEGES